MNKLERKEIISGRASRALEVAKKAAFVAAAAAGFASTASAQSYSSSSSSLNYSFQLDPGSLSQEANLTVTDNGQEVYNLDSVFPSSQYFAPYSMATGAASAQAYNPSSSYDNTALTGSQEVSMYSDAYGSGGYALASVGSQENLNLVNAGNTAITIDISATAYLSPDDFVNGATTSTNYAYSKTYAGIYAFDTNGGATSLEDYVELTGSSDAGYSTQSSGPWSQIDPSDYFIADTLTIQAGQSLDLDFYTSGQTSAAFNAVPTPTGWVTLGVGMLGLLIRRPRKRTK